MKFSTLCKKTVGSRLAVIVAFVWMLALAAARPLAVDASCLDIADVPLDSLEQAAPGMIMFVFDDSGSMDWSIMCPPSEETDGVFNGNYYIFKNPGDDVYSRDNLEDIPEERMMWMSQWAGYNGLYYDPATEYEPWPGQADADVDHPRSNPMNSSHTLDMTTVWDQLAVDNRETGTARFETTGTWSSSTSSGRYGPDYLFADGGVQDRSATWTDSELDPYVAYNVEVRWNANASASRSDAVTYRVYDASADFLDPETNKIAEMTVNQQVDPPTGDWYLIASNVTFPSGTGIVQLYENTNTSGLCADAVRFVPVDGSINDIMRRHYFVQNDNGTFLVNLRSNAFEYYAVGVAPANDKREVVSVGKLVRLTDDQADSAGIVTGRTYAQECQNFANWYSYYRRRELTAKNAIAKVVDTMDGVYIGMLFINDYGNKDTAVLPVGVNLSGVTIDQSADLLDLLYHYDIQAYGTPLRNGLDKAGRYFKGDYLKPATLPAQTNTDTYPYFKADEGGSCQQAFTILFSDGYYNSTPTSIGNTDGDGNTNFDGDPFGDSVSNTLADFAMRYYENDLNATLNDNVAVTQVDPADHQHMVTYTIAFGVTGSLDVDLYKDCPTGSCPASWPSTSTSSGKIDDMFHAAINGRGSYLSANSTTELNEALQALKNDISHRLGSAAALATNSVNLTVGSVVYQGTYNTANWYGEVSAMPLCLSTGAVGTPLWVASDQMPDWGDRAILTLSGAAGVVFDAANLSTTQQSQLTAPGLGTAEEMVNFIKGDTSNSIEAGGTLRNRSHPIGDVVHSEPTFFKGIVYIGANDGMLHAFDAATGVELFAYVPNLVYDHLPLLADPGYTHQYYVDNTAAVGKVAGRHLLVSGLGKGGKGYFALDVTDASTVTSGNLAARANTMARWEFSDQDLGYSFSKAVIVKTEAAGNVVIFGNGYESTNGKAVLYVLELNDDLTIKNVHKLDTGVAGCNGLATPAVVDVQLDGIVDFAYAGDLKGNLWKFDLRGADATQWGVYYEDSGTPMPLVTVQNPSGDVQPITARPEVMLDCVVMHQGRGLMVVFGTGKFLSQSDFLDNSTQAFYGIWDWGNMWESDSGVNVAKTKFLGNVASDRSLSQLPTGVGLLAQTTVAEDANWGLVSDYSPQWYDPFDGTGVHLGWVMDLVETGERSLREPMLRDGVAVLVSTVPSISACTAGGSSYVYQISACTGGKMLAPMFDINADGKIDVNDKVPFVGFPEPEPPSRWRIEKILFDPIEISDELYLPDDQGDINQFDVVDNPQGMFYWRVLGL